MKKISVVIVDDHQLIRQMWRLMLAADDQIEVTGESGTLPGAVEMIKTKRPEIVLLDINLGLDSGMQAVPEIRKYSPGTRIIVVSMHTQTSYVKKMLQLGARAYITKNSSREELFNAIHEVMNGGIYVCQEISDNLKDSVTDTDPDQPQIKDLSLREIEIIKLIKEGRSSKDISVELHIGIRTVEVHRYNMLKKLKLKNTAALINFINNTDLNFI